MEANFWSRLYVPEMVQVRQFRKTDSLDFGQIEKVLWMKNLQKYAGNVEAEGIMCNLGGFQGKKDGREYNIA